MSNKSSKNHRGRHEKWKPVLAMNGVLVSCRGGGMYLYAYMHMLKKTIAKRGGMSNSPTSITTAQVVLSFCLSRMHLWIEGRTYAAGDRRMQPARMTWFTECSRWPAKNAAGDRQMHNLHEMMWAGDRPITKLAGNRWMQPVTGELTWFGFLATHIGEKMVASTIF